MDRKDACDERLWAMQHRGNLEEWHPYAKPITEWQFVDFHSSDADFVSTRVIFAAEKIQTSS